MMTAFRTQSGAPTKVRVSGGAGWAKNRNARTEITGRAH
jgi:hypothetical protein